MDQPPTPRILEEALRDAHRSDMRMETTVLGLLVLLPLLWLAMALEREMDAAKIFLLSAAAACVSIPALLVPLKFTPTQRRILVHGGILRLLLPFLLPRTLPWRGAGLLSAAGDAVGLSAHARLAAAGWARLRPWRLVPGIWIGRADGRICACRRIPEGWILVAAREERGPTSPPTDTSRSRR